MASTTHVWALPSETIGCLLDARLPEHETLLALEASGFPARSGRREQLLHSGDWPVRA
jgi:hypothetical protein